MCDVIGVAIVAILGIVNKVIDYVTDPCKGPRRHKPVPTSKPLLDVKDCVCTCRFMTCLRPRVLDDAEEAPLRFQDSGP